MRQRFPRFHLLPCAVLVAGTLAAQAPPAQQAPPAPTLAYQGRLLEGTLPVTGTRAFTFQILDEKGTVLWDSGPLEVAVNSGLY